jgi:hypothetical protein
MSMPVMALVASGIQAVSSIQQGRYQQAMYNLQAQQAELQGRQNALNYSNQALQVLERQRKMSATIIARGAAGGIDPFSGSPMTVDRWNAFKAGEEYNLGMENADMAIAGGLAQSQSLQAAGKQAMKTAYFNAAVSIAQGVYGYSKGAGAGGAGGAGTAPALDPGFAFESAITEAGYYGTGSGPLPRY